MELLNLSDLVSAGVAAAHAAIHNQKKLEWDAGANALSSIAGRIATYYLTANWFDKVTFGFVNASAKNYLSVFIVRLLIAYAMKEQQIMKKAWDTTLTDAFGYELMTMFVEEDKVLIGGGAPPKR